MALMTLMALTPSSSLKNTHSECVLPNSNLQATFKQENLQGVRAEKVHFYAERRRRFTTEGSKPTFSTPTHSVYSSIYFTMTTIPQPIIVLLQPEKDFSYIKFLGSQRDKEYYILSYHDDEIIEVGFPLVASWQNQTASLLDPDQAFEILNLFIKN